MTVVGPVMGRGDRAREGLLRRGGKMTTENTLILATYDPGVRPNWSFLPFMTILSNLVGSTVAVVIVCLVGTTVLGALAWAAGNYWDHGRASQMGKAGVVVSLVAAFVVGGASALVKWAAESGAGF